MSRYQTVLFDLDGTILDSKPGILFGMQHMLHDMGIEKSQEELLPYIGPPIQDTVKDFFSDKETQQMAVSRFRFWYDHEGLYNAEVYDGIEKMLVGLKRSGCRCCIATSKPEILAKKVLSHFDLDSFFEQIAGTKLVGAMLTKTDIVRKLVDQYGTESTVMVGDRKFDLLSASECNILAIGVLYGYGSAEELQSCNPMYICNSVGHLSEYLMYK